MASDLVAHNLVKIYGKRTVVDHVSFRVAPGEVVGLLGPNGAGKTTSFYAVVGLVRPDGGKVTLGDDDLTRDPMHVRARKGVGYLPQEPSVFRKLSVEDNIAAILELQGLDKGEAADKLEALLDEFNLQKVRKSMGDVLSGGERRRTEIARALASNPAFILLDEPFAGVDPIAVEDIQRIVDQLRHKGIGVLITDHNVQETLHITDRAYLLFEGKILKEGKCRRTGGRRHRAPRVPRAKLHPQATPRALSCASSNRATYLPITSNSKFMGAPTGVLCKLVCSQVYGMMATENSPGALSTTVRLMPASAMLPLGTVIHSGATG